MGVGLVILRTRASIKEFRWYHVLAGSFPEWRGSLKPKIVRISTFFRNTYIRVYTLAMGIAHPVEGSFICPKWCWEKKKEHLR